MSTELTTEQIASVFAMYLGCEITYENEHSTLQSVSDSGLLGDENRDESGEGWYDVSDCKLLLTPLSEISDEDAIEVAKILIDKKVNAVVKNVVKGGYTVSVGAKLLYRFEFYTDGGLDLDIWKNNDWVQCTPDLVAVHYAYEYLRLKEIAVPLFIEPNHPLNGKTAIELGIATTQKLIA